MRFENNKNPNEEWKKFKEEFLKLESKALDYTKDVFKDLKILEVKFDPNDECEIPGEGDDESKFVTAYTPEFKLGEFNKYKDKPYFYVTENEILDTLNSLN